MKLEIADVSITRREVEVPDLCPECKADLTGNNGVVEFNVVQYAQVNGVLGKDGFEPDGHTRLDGALYDPSGYACGACGHTLSEGTTTLEETKS